MQNEVDKIMAKLSSPHSLVASLDDHRLKLVSKNKTQNYTILNPKLTGYKVLLISLGNRGGSCWRQASGPSVGDSESGDGEGKAEEGNDRRLLRNTGQVLSVWP